MSGYGARVERIEFDPGTTRIPASATVKLQGLTDAYEAHGELAERLSCVEPGSWITIMLDPIEMYSGEIIEFTVGRHASPEKHP
jgi:hypothetical protein